MQSRGIGHLGALALLLALILLAPSNSLADDDCTAELTIEMIRTEGKESEEAEPEEEEPEEGEETEAEPVEMTYTFQVDVTVEENCAVVQFDVVTRESLPDGEFRSIRMPRRLTARGGPASEQVKLKTSSENTLMSWEVEQTDCRKCGG